MVVAVVGAKGGVGTSLVASSFAVYLSTLGRHVVAIDADRRGGNLHMFVGGDQPGGLPHAIALDRAMAPAGSTRAVTSAAELDPSPSASLVDTEVPGLRLMHGGIEGPLRGSSESRTYAQLWDRLSGVDANFVVVDLGAGLQRDMGEFWADSNHRLFVLTPDPGAVASMYRAVRIAFATEARRHMQEDPQLLKRFDMVIKEAGGAPIPLDLLQFAQQERPEFEAPLTRAIDEFEFPFVVNQASLRSDMELGSSLVSAAAKRYGVMLTDRGHIEEDNAVAFAAKRMRPLLLESPGAKASRAIEKIARRMTAKDGRSRRVTMTPVNHVPVGTHHDWLGVDRFASDEEIRRAYKRSVAIFDPSSIAIHGLMTREDLESIRRRIEEAHEVLLDARRRDRYEASVFPDERPASDGFDNEVAPSGPPPPAPEIDATTEYTGALLQAVRRSRGVALAEISSRTKVGTGYLRSIEEEDFGSLPAPVYVRGFVAEYAKMLGIDADEASRGYVRRYEAYLQRVERDMS